MIQCLELMALASILGFAFYIKDQSKNTALWAGFCVMQIAPDSGWQTKDMRVFRIPYLQTPELFFQAAGAHEASFACSRQSFFNLHGAQIYILYILHTLSSKVLMSKGADGVPESGSMLTTELDI